MNILLVVFIKLTSCLLAHQTVSTVAAFAHVSLPLSLFSYPEKQCNRQYNYDHTQNCNDRLWLHVRFSFSFSYKKEKKQRESFILIELAKNCNK